MKMRLIATFAACSAILGLVIAMPHPAQSATLGIGAAGWYTWWDPKPSTREAEADPTLMYGPQLLLAFTPVLSISSIFLYGKFAYDDRSVHGSTSMDIKRYDSDTTLTYSLNPYIRLFGGLKFMGYKYDTGDHYGAGPGLGLGLVLPLAERLFWSVGLSGLYLWGEQSNEESTGKVTMNFREYGANCSAALIYTVSSSVNLSLGGRYFYFQFKPTADQYSEQKEKHHFYGITASAMYMISL